MSLQLKFTFAFIENCSIVLVSYISKIHDDVIKWKHFPRYWPFVRGSHRSPVNSPHKGQWHGALMFSVICAWIKYWVNNRETGDFRRHRIHYNVTVMIHNRHLTMALPWVRTPCASVMKWEWKQCSSTLFIAESSATMHRTTMTGIISVIIISNIWK